MSLKSRDKVSGGALPNMRKALHSIPSTKKKEEKNGEKMCLLPLTNEYSHFSAPGTTGFTVSFLFESYLGPDTHCHRPAARDHRSAA